MTDSAYELIRPLSSGGMGEVYVARRTGSGSFEKRVALKLMLPHLMSAPDQLDRFYREARLSARMHHPNIVEVFDVGELRGRPFIAMQLVEGVTLERLIREAARRGLVMPLPVLNAVATGLLEALQYAHALTDDEGARLEVIHRDVTPGNVLVSRTGAVLLTDFGIARVGGTIHTAPGTVRGKPAYLSPEQILEHAPVDSRSDLFSSAVTLYEAATNQHPFRKQTDGATLHAVVSTTPPLANTLRADLPAAFSAALAQGLALEPSARPATAMALRELLVEGPIAGTAEVATWVRALCPEEPLGSAPPVTLTSSVAAPEDGRQTLELGSPRGDAELPVQRRSWRRALAVVAGLTGVAALSGWAVSASREPAGQPEASRSDRSAPVPSNSTSEGTAQAGSQVFAGAAGAHDDASATDAGLAVVVGPRPNEQPPVERPAPRPAASNNRQKLGYLTADARPWADVLLGGAVIDRTPFIKYPLKAGRHVLTFRGPSGETVERKVIITEHGTTSVRVDFPE